MCGDFYKVSYYFEFFEKSLDKEYEQRTEIKEYFPETELWYILDSVVQAGAYFETQNIAIGDICS